jgi:hypothetical protein
MNFNGRVTNQLDKGDWVFFLYLSPRGFFQKEMETNHRWEPSFEVQSLFRKIKKRRESSGYIQLYY